MSDDKRIDDILNLIIKIAGGQLDARGVCSERNDQFDAIILGLNMLAEEFERTMITKEKYRRTKEQAVIANKAKSEFLSRMSHEIRTPLNTIIGFSEIMTRQIQLNYSPDKFQHYLENIQISSHNLLNLINNVLDISKIEAGKTLVYKSSFNLKELVDEIFRINQERALSKNLKFFYEYSDHMPLQIHSDRQKLHQILTNLVSNAIKFTAAGNEVSIAVSQVDHFISIEVEDEGVGIPPDRLETIFEAFEQVDGSTTQQFGGTGLGLTIVKQLVTLLEGNIEARSRPQEGSVFLVKIPLEVADEKNQATSKKPQLRNLKFSPNSKILVIDDDELSLELIRVLLQNLGLQVEYSNDSNQGVWKALNLSPDLVFMDIRMPGMNGYEATQMIRNHPAGKEIPVIALSAEVFEEERNKTIQAGMNDYLAKPLRVNNLMEILIKYLPVDPHG